MSVDDRMDAQVVARFRREWPMPVPDHERVVEFLTRSFRRYFDAGLADREFANQLANGPESVYHQRLGEMLLADVLWNDGFALSSSDQGPDFHAEKNGESLWIELITPEPTGLPEEYLRSRDLPGSGAFHYPAQEILLRWTAAIREKACKLLGDPRKGTMGYLEKCIVKPEDRYVIAINDRRLSVWPDGMTGISQFPFPVEALLAVGPYAVTIGRATLKATRAGHQRRHFILNRNEARVRTNTFFDPDYSAISAVLGITLREQAVLGRPHRNALVYNPLASNPLPHKLLTSQEHWVCDVGRESYTIHRLDDEPMRADWTAGELQ